MPRSADFLPQTTVELGTSDATASVLEELRVAGSLLLAERYESPWTLEVPEEAALSSLLALGREVKVVPFHFVRQGVVELRARGRAPRLVSAGEVVVVTDGVAHQLGEGRGAKGMGLADVLSGRRRPPASGRTSMVCGAFLLRHVRFNPLFGALPSVIHRAVAGPSAGYVTRGVADLLVAELTSERGGRSWMIARLLELLCAELMLSAERPEPAWFRAVTDASVGPALDAFHRAPGEGWDVARLARAGALSPSRFAARFRELLRLSPMAYVTRWRLTLAARQLREGAESVERVGEAVGYESLPAFSRAFKRQWGVAPSAMRRVDATA